MTQITFYLDYLWGPSGLHCIWAIWFEWQADQRMYQIVFNSQLYIIINSLFKTKTKKKKEALESGTWNTFCLATCAKKRRQDVWHKWRHCYIRLLGDKSKKKKKKTRIFLFSFHQDTCRMAGSYIKWFVLVCQDCYNKISQTGWFKQQKIIFSHSWC